METACHRTRSKPDSGALCFFHICENVARFSDDIETRLELRCGESRAGGLERQMNPSVVLCTALTGSASWKSCGQEQRSAPLPLVHRRPLDVFLKLIDWVMVSAEWARS
jgi:hypothetical protein